MATTPFDSLRDLDRWLAGNMVRTPASVGMPLDLSRDGEPLSQTPPFTLILGGLHLAVTTER